MTSSGAVGTAGAGQAPGAIGVSADRRQTLCQSAQSTVRASVDVITATLREQLPSYSRLSLDEQRRTVRETTDLFFERLAQGVGPTASDLSFARRAARRRAMEGVSAYDVLATFNIVSGMVWKTLRELGEPTPEVLLDLVAPLNRWTRQMSEAVISAFADEPLNRQAHDSVARENLFERLGQHGAGADLRALSHELAFDPDGPFRGFCAPRSFWSTEALAILHRSARQLPGILHFGYRGDRLVGLTQHTAEQEVVDLLRETAGDRCPFGVGLEREGLVGAELSLGDAERALHLGAARGLAVQRFADVWLDSTVSDAADRLSPLFAKARQTAETSPDLAETVRVFADSGFSLAAAAQVLGVHPNSVGYRLDRWRELTGLDPRGYRGLTQSMVALGVAPSVAPSHSSSASFSSSSSARTIAESAS
ncbi:PucR family transcriptional regulator [Subtercola sp. YIM 133946]|uniref:PucR family transcriptional regulator n=1 Tax=Subtercola sp. YIM 133946 TaxID=3118909 RepID=UPI002F93F298